MKFLISHRNDILSCFAQQGFSKESFSFTKKKGRIIITHIENKKWFSFYKRKDFFFDPDTSEKIDISHFEVKTSTTDLLKVNLWQDVISKLIEWLKT